MEIKRATEIFVETKRRFVIHQPESNEQLVCPECAARMLTAEQTAVLLGISRRSVYRLAETGAAHFSETGNGFLFLCPNSLAQIKTQSGESYENI